MKLAYKKKRIFELSSLKIRLIAIIAMIGSFLASSNINGFHNNTVAQCFLWFSYTLFAFLLSEGVHKTSNKLMYLERFALFTIISEVAFDLYTYNSFFNIKSQSIMLTLLVALLIMFICEFFREKYNNYILNILLIIGLSIGGINLCSFIKSQFPMYGIILCMIFYVSYNLTYKKIFEIIAFIFLCSKVTSTAMFVITVNNMMYSVTIAIISILALFVTWLYNQKRGPNSIGLKIVYYLVYPLILTTFFLLSYYQII